MIEVFKTTIRTKKNSQTAILSIIEINNLYKVNFDLEDIDNILRVENPFGKVDTERVIKTINSLDHQCEILE